LAIKIEYYSDILCIWAWIAHRRQEELVNDFGDDVVLECRYVNVFGSTQTKIGEGWADRDGFIGFGEHVRSSAEPFPDAPVHEAIWQTVRPTGSAPAHTVLKAIELTQSPAAAEAFAYELRKRFFTGNVDISQLTTLLAIAQEAGFDADALNDRLDSGEALAAVMHDYQAAQAQGIKGSPSWVLDNGRQVLYGNVGYRVLRANVQELLKNPQGEASWC
jgi:predicted DsbA family dithiol-disulfide isomerase